MPRPARGASYDGEALCVVRSERARVQRHTGTLSAAFLALSPATTNNSYSSGILGAADQGKAVGVTSWRWRLPSMHLVCTPDPNTGSAPQLEVLSLWNPIRTCPPPFLVYTILQDCSQTQLDLRHCWQVDLSPFQLG